MESYGVFVMLLAALILSAVPSALARKCYVCNSIVNPGCGDANQISQLYTDCSVGGGQYGGSYAGQQPYPGGIQQGGFGGQPGQYPQQLGQQGNPGGYGGYGGVGGDRCIKTTTVNQQSQPVIIRSCGSANGMAGDGCFWQGLMQVCTCNWNYCNGSSRLSSASTSAILIASFATLLSYFYRNSL